MVDVGVEDMSELDDKLDEIFASLEPNETEGDISGSYDANDCIEYELDTVARENDTHECLTCGQKECKPWHGAKLKIKQAFSDAGYHTFRDRDGSRFMAGQEWYDRFEKELNMWNVKDKVRSLNGSMVKQLAKKASGIE